MRRADALASLLFLVWVVASTAIAVGQETAISSQTYDVIIRNGQIVDGTGNPWYRADIGVRGDRIAAIGNLSGSDARLVIDAKGLVVSPGFVDMLGQSEMALLIDNRSLSKLSQGITSEITGEGWSITPENEKTIEALKPFLNANHVEVDWHDLDGYFHRLETNGIPLNIGTYVSSGQVRRAILGDANREPTADELKTMESLVAQAMRQGAMGLASALIYPPSNYAKTDELVALARVASQCGGLYASHIRSEGQTEMAALDEAIQIGQEAHLPVEIFHLKVSGKARWGAMPMVVEKIEAARAGGLDIAANMYPYLAGGTALAYALPPWAAEGGQEKLLERLRDPASRRRIAEELAVPHLEWENTFLNSGGGGGVIIATVRNSSLKQYEGETLRQIALEQGKSEIEALLDFVVADDGQTSALFSLASENDLQVGLRQPWTSIGLDANETSLDGPLFEPHNHPRAWGSMPRFVGHYSRDLHLLPLEQAIRKITSLPAEREHLVDRGLIERGFFADLTIFRAGTIEDVATYAEPNRVSNGVIYVLVNGVVEYANGKLTGARAGRPLRGSGYNSEECRVSP